MTTVDEEDYYTPLTDQRVFGAGIKRKRIDFVPASTTVSELTTVTPIPPAERASTVGNHYLSIVLPKSAAASSSSSSSEKTEEAQDQSLNTTATTTSICPICKQPVPSRSSSSPSGRVAVNSNNNSHESSIAHQVCLEHSYQPSHLDRERAGVKYLAAYGWDVDSRKGLGAREEGIRIPIKVKEKKDTVGLRETVNDDDDDDGTSTRVKKKNNNIVKRQEKPVLLDAKQLKRRAIEETKRMERLRQSFYGPDLEQYLGPDG